MKAVRWEDTKRQVRQAHPGWDSPERARARERGREELRAMERGHQLAQLRKGTGLTQAQVAAAMGGVAGPGVPDRARQDHRDGCGPRLRGGARRGWSTWSPGSGTGPSRSPERADGRSGKALEVQQESTATGAHGSGLGCTSGDGDLR
jgi:hypothetical protein